MTSIVRTTRKTVLSIATLIVLPLLLVNATQALAADGPKRHSEVDASVKALADGKLEFTFKVTHPKENVPNFDAPWKMEIKNAPGLAFAETKLTAGALKKEIPGFTLTTKDKPSAASGEAEYTLVAFVCTKTKDNCFRDVHTGKVSWTRSK